MFYNFYFCILTAHNLSRATGGWHFGTVNYCHTLEYHNACHAELHTYLDVLHENCVDVLR